MCALREPVIVVVVVVVVGALAVSLISQCVSLARFPNSLILRSHSLAQSVSQSDRYSLAR